jgi:hypothetical protein
MNNIIALSVNPGKLYYGFDFSRILSIMTTWKGNLFELGDNLVYSEVDYRINVSCRGEIVIYITDISSEEKFTNIIIKALPQVAQIIKLIDKQILTFTLHLYLPEDDSVNSYHDKKDVFGYVAKELQFKFGKCLSLCSVNFGNNDCFGDITAKIECLSY